MSRRLQTCRAYGAVFARYFHAVIAFAGIKLREERNVYSLTVEGKAKLHGSGMFRIQGRLLA